jgi:uncharacterized protein
MQDERPVPRPTALSTPHWDGARLGRLMVQRCDDCGQYVFPPKPVCAACFSPRLSWVHSCGEGSVYSYTIVHRPPDSSFSTPFCAAIIEVEEGWFMLSNLVGVPMDEIAVGMSVKVSFVDVGRTILPMFVASGDAE